MSTNKKNRLPPPISDESEETKTVSIAYKLARQQLENGSATSQVITHFLKLGTVKESIQLEKLRLENQLLEAKIESERSQQLVEEMFSEVIEALKKYTVHDD